jgi:hypothetical protein
MIALRTPGLDRTEWIGGHKVAPLALAPGAFATVRDNLANLKPEIGAAKSGELFARPAFRAELSAGS